MSTRSRTAASSAVPVADVTAALGSVFAALGVALVATYLSTPAFRPWLSDRNGLVALFTDVAYAGAAVLGLWAAHRAVAESRFRFVIPGIAVWGLVDRARYGLGIFPDDLPQISFADAGASLGAWAIPLGIGSGLGAALAVGIVLAGIALHRALRRWAEGRVMTTEARVVDLLAAAVTVIAGAPVVSLFGDGAGVGFAAQLTRLVGATLLVLAALASGDHRRTVAGWRGRMRPWMTETCHPQHPLTPP